MGYLPTGEEGFLVLSFGLKNLFLRERWRSRKLFLKAKLKLKSWDDVMLKMQGGEVVIPFACLVAVTQSSALCVRGESREGGGLFFKQSWEEGYCTVFPYQSSKH